MGPLSGVKVVELAGIGPGPFAGMLLADMGAEVVLVERASSNSEQPLPDSSRRGKRAIALNLKSKEGAETLLGLVAQADILFEGFRPGVMEKLGLGPDVCLARNPKLIYGRMTGWGQYGPYSQAAGHDINYISLTGALNAIGPADGKPVPPLNLVGDFGGGGMYLVVGLLAALFEAQKSGQGQVIDAAMTDGSASLMSFFHSMHAMGGWNSRRGDNLLDGTAHFYDSYETSDGKYISIGSIEPQFYALLIEKAELDPQIFADQNDAKNWPALKVKLTEVFKTKTRDQWCEIMEATDVCFAPVLDFEEASSHPHNVARKTYIELDGFSQPAPAPRFSRTESEVAFGSRVAGADTEKVLADWGFDQAQIDTLKTTEALS